MYSQWRERMAKARDDASPVFTPRGNSLQVNLGGVTERAGEMRSPRVSGFIWPSACRRQTQGEGKDECVGKGIA